MSKEYDEIMAEFGQIGQIKTSIMRTKLVPFLGYLEKRIEELEERVKRLESDLAPKEKE